LSRLQIVVLITGKNDYGTHREENAVMKIREENNKKKSSEE
jgi:hypothetical protein